MAFPCKACALAGIRHATGSTTLKRRLWHRGLAYQGQRVDMCLLDQRGLQVASRRTEHVQHGVVYGCVRRLNAKLYLWSIAMRDEAIPVEGEKSGLNGHKSCHEVLLVSRIQCDRRYRWKNIPEKRKGIFSAGTRSLAPVL